VKENLIHKIQGSDLPLEGYYYRVFNVYGRKTKVLLRYKP